MTVAVRLPAVLGFFENVTVNEVALAAVTVPVAPLFRTTELFAATVSNPNPSMVTVVASGNRSAVLEVITGVTVATWTAAPLATPLEVTTAVRLPAEVGLVVKVTVMEVDDAVVTVPTAPLLNTTVLLLPVASNPNPVIVSVEASAERLLVLLVTTGRTVATWILEPLLMPLLVTVALKLPAVGFVESETVNVVAVAAETVPSAPESKTTVLFAAVVSNPTPTMTMDAELADWIEAELVSTTGATVATTTPAPLLCVLVVTDALNVPAVVGFVEKVTVSDVADAVVTVPTAPLLSVTVLLAAVVSKP